MSLVSRSFLLSKSILLLKEKNFKSYYDQDLDMNCFAEDEGVAPVVMHGELLATQSKTFAAPGDDDPDREGESCY